MRQRERATPAAQRRSVALPGHGPPALVPTAGTQQTRIVLDEELKRPQRQIGLWGACCANMTGVLDPVVREAEL